MRQATKKQVITPALTPRLIRLLREVALYFLGTIALYLLIALLSYNPLDPAWSHRGISNGVQNVGGPFGAWLSDVLFTLVGYLAYLIPVMVAYAGWRVFLHRKDDSPPDIRQKVITGTGGLLVVMGGCGLAALHFSVSTAVPFNSGGVIGNLVGKGLVSAFSFVGATLFLLALFLSGVTLFTGLSWLRAMDTVGWLTIELVQRTRYGFGTIVDRIKGLQARRERKETVAIEKEKLNKHPPPRIEPVIQKIKPSIRSEREKQVPLFEVPAGGELPALSLLDHASASKQPSFSRQSLESMSRLVEKKLLDFNIEAQVVAVHPGPVITRFEIEPSPGIKASQITNLAKDLARSLSVISLRVVENIPGKTTIGLEVPNEIREIVRLREVLSSEAFDEVRSPMTLALGKDISGQPVIEDLGKMPHLLIAGTTGSGKSVCVNALIMSMVYKSTPEQLRLIMIDPKMLELSVYEGIPHLLAPVVTDMKQAGNALRWCIAEMERRYHIMAALGVRNISGYNRKISEAEDAGKSIPDPLFKPDEHNQTAPALTALPYIVILIDELADMMMVVGKKVEQLIARLAQKARAAGLHLIVATQRPSVDVITGLIKANIPARISFQVSSRVDSRTVIDQMGAEQLLGHGDMLVLQPGQGVPTRVHGSFVDDHEVHKVAAALKRSAKPIYNDAIIQPDTSIGSAASAFSAGIGNDDESDPLYDEALAIVTESRRASISGVQRRLRIGYNRAARLIEQMEKTGVVGPLQSNGSREVLAPPPPSK